MSILTLCSARYITETYFVIWHSLEEKRKSVLTSSLYWCASFFSVVSVFKYWYLCGCSENLNTHFLLLKLIHRNLSFQSNAVVTSFNFQSYTKSVFPAMRCLLFYFFFSPAYSSLFPTGKTQEIGRCWSVSHSSISSNDSVNYRSSETAF